MFHLPCLCSFYSNLVEILGTDQRRKALGKEELAVVNSTLIPNITILFPPSLKGNKSVSTFIEYVTCIRYCVKFLFYFNLICLSTISKILFLFYKKRKLRTNWAFYLTVSHCWPPQWTSSCAQQFAQQFSCCCLNILSVDC